MAVVPMPRRPVLVNCRRVELMHAGTWNLSTGWATFSRSDLIAAAGAQACPAVRNPVLKLGHTDPRIPPRDYDGTPTIGWVGNITVELDGNCLVGDYMGLPGWMTEIDAAGNSVLASAFPDRSVEGCWNFRCQLGHLHPFVVTAVALLGEVPPGIGTIASLQDVAALYAGTVTASAATGDPVTVTITAARKETTVPAPNPIVVAGSVTLDDLREEFNEAASWDQWITEVILDPLQLIVMDDGKNCLMRVPVTVGADGSITFGTPVEVKVNYVDVGAGDQDQSIEPGLNATAGTAPSRLVFASRAESRPGIQSAPPPNPAAPAPLTPTPPSAAVPAAAPEPTTEPKEGDTVSTLSDLRSRLGLPEDAVEDAIWAALDERLGKKPADQPAQPDAQPTTEPGPAPTDPTPVPEPAPEPEPAAPVVQPEGDLVTVGAKTGQAAKPAAAAVLPAGVVAIDEATLNELRRDAKAGAAARRRQEIEDRDRYIDTAVKAGKIPPGRRPHWTQAYDADPDGTRATIDALATGLVPVDEPRGYAGDPDDSDAAFDKEFAGLFRPEPAATSTKGA